MASNRIHWDPNVMHRKENGCDGLGKASFPKNVTKALAYLASYGKTGQYGCGSNLYIKYNFETGQYCCSQSSPTMEEYMDFILELIRPFAEHTLLSPKFYRDFLAVRHHCQFYMNWITNFVGEEEKAYYRGKLNELIELAELDKQQMYLSAFRPLNEEERLLENMTRLMHRSAEPRLNPEERRAKVMHFNRLNALEPMPDDKPVGQSTAIVPRLKRSSSHGILKKSVQPTSGRVFITSDVDEKENAVVASEAASSSQRIPTLAVSPSGRVFVVEDAEDDQEDGSLKHGGYYDPAYDDEKYGGDEDDEKYGGDDQRDEDDEKYDGEGVVFFVDDDEKYDSDNDSDTESDIDI